MQKKCTAGEFEQAKPAGTHDRVCAACPANTHSRAEASSCDLCNSGYGSTNVTDAVGHVVCETCANANHKYNSQVDESGCGDVPMCGPEYGYIVSPSQGPDETVGDDCVACVAGKYSSTTDYSSCHTHDTCTLDQTYEIQAATNSSNRICTAVTTCEPGVSNFGSLIGDEYEVSQPTLTQDRTCKAVATCEFGVSYQTTAPTATSDRACSPVSNCTLGTTYESTTPTLTQNRECSALAECTLGTTYESTAPTLTQNRVCSPVTTCRSDQLQHSAPTLTSDRACYSCDELVTYHKQTCTTGYCFAQCPSIKQLYNKHCQTCSN